MADARVESSGCYCQTRGLDCRQGRTCPLLHETEAANDLAAPWPDFPAPKGKKRMYRLSSSAYTGRAPRTLSSAFGCSMRDPVHPMPTPRPAGLFARFTAWLFGR
jgi:hypothetical protein